MQVWDGTLRVGGRKYRHRWFRPKQEPAPVTSNVVATRSECPRCGASSLHLQAEGDPEILFRAFRAPVRCRQCGLRFAVGWRPAPATRDMYMANKAGVPVTVFRRYRDMARMYGEGDGPRGA